MTLLPVIDFGEGRIIQAMKNGNILVGNNEIPPFELYTPEFANKLINQGWPKKDVTNAQIRVKGWVDCGAVDLNHGLPEPPEYVVYQRITNPDATIQEGDYVQDNFGTWGPTEYAPGSKLGDWQREAILRPVPNAEVTNPDEDTL